MITIQQRFAICVQTALSLHAQRNPNVPTIRLLRCIEEACRIPSRYYRDLDVPAEAYTFAEYWMRGAKPKERPEWLAHWIKERRPES